MKSGAKVFSPPRQKSPKTLILELDYNHDLEDFSKTIDNFKELKINQKQELVKNEEDDINILYFEDSELMNLVNRREFPDKEFNIVNRFITVEEEENLLNKKVNSNLNLDLGTSDDSIIISQLNQKKLLDEEFQPGLFTSFDFKDKIKSLIYNSLTPTKPNFKFSYDYNRKSNKIFGTNSSKNFDSSSSEDEKKLHEENLDNDGLILDLCLNDKDLESENIVINFNEEEKEEQKKDGSILDEEKNDFQGFNKKEAIPEYENQIISFQNYYQIEHREDVIKHPEIEEDSFNGELFDYLAKVSKTIQDKGLKNKIKLIMKQIIYQDDKSKKPIFENKEKNELLMYWKNSYMKELEEMVFKEKNRILQEKLENSDPYEQYLELVKKRRQGKKKPRTRKSVLGFNNLIGSSKSINIFNNSKSFPRAKIKKYPNTGYRKKKDQKK